MPNRDPNNSLDTLTSDPMSLIAGRTEVVSVTTLTIVCHADVSRIGERVLIPGSATVALSRQAPMFKRPGGATSRALSDPYLSRKPVALLTPKDKGLHVRAMNPKTPVLVDGETIEEHFASQDDLERGVVMQVGVRCTFVVHKIRVDLLGERGEDCGLVGESDGMLLVREHIATVAKSKLRVLIRGETGTGKELVARAIHDASSRADDPYVGVNMAAIQPTLAASALFGHERGAFSGAVDDHQGHFTQADCGTLFLDEIGDLAPEVQVMMLRTLETSDVQPIGAKQTHAVDVRLLSATDADLEAAIAAGTFREPLLHRVAEYTLRLPPLRERREDIGRLALFFLRDALEQHGALALLDAGDAKKPWLNASVMAALCRGYWTGNVRQLRNVVRQLAVDSLRSPRLLIDESIEASFGAPTPIAKAAAVAESGERRRLEDIDIAEVLRALEKHGYRRAAAAKELGISRSSLYAFIDASPGIQKASELSASQIADARERVGDVKAMAALLKVSLRGLKLRMTELGIS